MGEVMPIHLDLRQFAEPALYLLDQRCICAEECRRHRRLARCVRSISEPNRCVERDRHSPAGSFACSLLDGDFSSHWRRCSVVRADCDLDQQSEYCASNTKHLGYWGLCNLAQWKHVRHHCRGRCRLYDATRVCTDHSGTAFWHFICYR